MCHPFRSGSRGPARKTVRTPLWPSVTWLQVVMNIISDIARRGSPCVLAPPSLAPEEWTLWERNTYECGMCSMHINAYCRRKKPVVKGMSTCEYNAIDSCSPCQFLQCLPQRLYWTWTCSDLPKDELPACGYTGTLARVHSSIIFCNVRTCHLQLQYAARMSSVRAMYKLFTTHLTLGKMAFSEGVVTIQGRIQEFKKGGSFKEVLPECAENFWVTPLTFAKPCPF